MLTHSWRILTRVVIGCVILGVVLLPGASARATGSHASIKRGGTVTISWGPKGSWTRNFNPFSNTPTDGTMELIYEPLLMFNQMKGGTASAWLAQKYKWSNGNKTLTFYLRPNVKWNDGKPFTSADLKFPAFTGNDSAQLAAVNGDLDWAGLLIPDAQSTYAAKSPDNHFWFQGVGAPVSLWLNNAHTPFNNVHFRRAIALAINRQMIA